MRCRRIKVRTHLLIRTHRRRWHRPLARMLRYHWRLQKSGRYYTRPMLRRLAETQAPILGRDSDELLTSVRHRALAALSEPATLDHLAGLVAEARIRRRLNEAAPTLDQVASGEDSLDIQIDNPFKAARQQLEQLVADQDLDNIVERYPIRNTPLRKRVATELGFREIRHLENAARRQLTTDEELLAALRQLAGPLPT